MCKEDGCDGNVVARGWCRKHYTRWHQWGDPQALKRPGYDLSIEERFRSQVHVPEDPDACHLWTGAVSPQGYGRFRSPAGRLAHRYAFWLANGYLPETVDHECHNNDPDCDRGDDDPHRRCVRADHLVDRSRVDNHKRGRVTRTACPKGHPYPETRERRGSYRCEQCYADSRDRAKANQRLKRNPTGRPRGAQLDWDTVRRLRAESAAGATRKELAERYGLSVQGVGHIVTGRTWKERPR